MNFQEFISDRYVSIFYNHYFEGLLFNSVPFVQRYKLRLVGHGRALFADLSEKNREMNLVNGSLPFYELKPYKPYLEAGWGVENIFKVIRVDFLYRLTYLNHKNTRPFGLMISTQFKL
jgi:hypothetical protein